MTRRTRRNHTPAFKAKVALAALKGDKTLTELALQFDVHTNRITAWRAQLLEGSAGVFGGERPAASTPAVDVTARHAKIGQLTLENDFLSGALNKAGLLGVSRSRLYYQPQPVSPEDLAIMRRMDGLHLEYPFAGSRMLRDLLRLEGADIGRDRVITCMKRMGIEAIYQRPNTSKPAPGHRVFPYLLRKVAVDRPNFVWAMDITYIPMAKGFVYLAAVVDWYSRRVLSWRLSVALSVDFCLEAVEEALERYGKPKIFNTDQGSQFTSEDFVRLMLVYRIEISMDGRGSWRDNAFVVREAPESIGRYLEFYNRKRPHSSLGGQAPDQAYFDHRPLAVAA
jgi:putative transposase